MRKKNADGTEWAYAAVIIMRITANITYATFLSGSICLKYCITARKVHEFKSQVVSYSHTEDY